MWVIAEYEATSLFSLKSNLATSSAGKTLLVPTPFALKMALLDASIRTRGLGQGKLDFVWLKDLDIAVQPAERAVVTNLFAKIQKPRRTDKKKEDAETETEESEEGTDGPFGPTIAYREYVHLQGSMRLAFQPKPGLFEAESLQILPNLLSQISYLGKRGGFFQLMELPFQHETLPEDFIELTSDKSFRLKGILQMLDDCGPELTFEKVDIYSEKPIRAGKDRISRAIVVPYELVRSSRSYSYYQRLE